MVSAITVRSGCGGRRQLSSDRLACCTAAFVFCPAVSAARHRCIARGGPLSQG